MQNLGMINQDGAMPIASLRIGDFRSALAGGGIRLLRSGTQTGGVRVYADDAGTVLWGTGAVPDIRGQIVRTLLTTDHTGGNVRVHSLMGQLKAYNAKWNGEVASAVHGRVELVRASGTQTYGGYGVTAAVLGVPSVSGAVTINTYHVLAGVAAISDFRATLTQTGKVAGLYVGAYDTTNWSDATARTTWGYGLLIANSAAATGISIGTTTGASIAFTGTLAKGLNFASATPAYADHDDAYIAIGTYNDAVTIANTSAFSFIPIQVNLSSTGNVSSAGQQVAAMRLRVDTDTNAQQGTAIACAQFRSDLGVSCYAYSGLSQSANISANITVEPGEFQVAFWQITGAGNIACTTGNVSVIEARMAGTGTGVDYVGLFSVNTAATIDSVIKANVGAGTVTNGVSIAGTMTTAISITGSCTTALQAPNDSLISIGTTTTTAETKITMEFDETTTGIGVFNMGDLSYPMILNTNPGATVVGHTVNILHSAGAGDCDDLLGSYTKVAFTGNGDSGTTAVGGAFRAYAGTTNGSTTAVSQLYAIQPWVSHYGTGAVTAMSALSAKCDVNTGNFTASTVNAGHFHIEGASTVTAQFDGVMIEVYPDVTCMDSCLALAVDSGAVVNSSIRLAGTSTFGIKVSATIPDLLQLTAGAAGTSCVFTNAAIPNVNSSHALRIDIDGTPHYIPVFSDLSWGS